MDDRTNVVSELVDVKTNLPEFTSQVRMIAAEVWSMSSIPFYVT